MYQKSSLNNAIHHTVAFVKLYRYSNTDYHGIGPLWHMSLIFRWPISRGLTFRWPHHAGLTLRWPHHAGLTLRWPLHAGLCWGQPLQGFFLIDSCNNYRHAITLASDNWPHFSLASPRWPHFSLASGCRPHLLLAFVWGPQPTLAYIHWPYLAILITWVNRNQETI